MTARSGVRFLALDVVVAEILQADVRRVRHTLAYSGVHSSAEQRRARCRAFVDVALRNPVILLLLHAFLLLLALVHDRDGANAATHRRGEAAATAVATATATATDRTRVAIACEVAVIALRPRSQQYMMYSGVVWLRARAATKTARLAARHGAASPPPDRLIPHIQ